MPGRVSDGKSLQYVGLAVALLALTISLVAGGEAFGWQFTDHPAMPVLIAVAAAVIAIGASLADEDD